MHKLKRLKVKMPDMITKEITAPGVRKSFIELSVAELEELNLDRPTIRPRMFGRSPASGVKNLGMLRGIADWDERIRLHKHRDNLGIEYICRDFGCEIYIWNDERFLKAMHPDLRDWAEESRDPAKAAAAIAFETHEKLKLILGPTGNLAGHRFRWRQIVGIVMTSGLIGYFVDQILGIF